MVPTPEGTRFQFYPYPETESGFPEYLAARFASLGEPADGVYDPETKCFDALFRGLHFKDAEEALTALATRVRPYPPKAGGAPGPS